MAIRRYLPWLLLACYAIAFAWPLPWLAQQKLEVPGWPGWAGEPRLPLLLLAVILFFAALALDATQLGEVIRRPGGLALSLLGIWLGPVLLVLLAAAVLPDNGLFAGPLVGMALVAAMPVANSSVAWSQQAGGNLSWSLALVVLSVVLNPWITPQLLKLVGWSLAGGQAAHVQELIAQSSGTVFIVWVLLPTALGMLSRMFLGNSHLKRFEPVSVIVSAVCLLTLNYVNASLVEWPRAALLAVVVTLAITLSLVGIVSALLVARLARLDRATRVALMFGLSMKHNGLALALAGTMLDDQPPAILFIVVAILVQHAIAAMVDAWIVRDYSDQPGSETVA